MDGREDMYHRFGLRDSREDRCTCELADWTLASIVRVRAVSAMGAVNSRKEKPPSQEGGERHNPQHSAHFDHRLNSTKYNGDLTERQRRCQARR